MSARRRRNDWRGCFSAEDHVERTFARFMIDFLLCALGGDWR
jgi:hypothetical protein